MEELIKFVSAAMFNGVVGSTTYNSLKNILKPLFNNCSNFELKDKEEFENKLKELLDNNVDLIQKIVNLQKENTVNNNIEISGNNSGIIVMGNNNSVR